MSPCAQVMNRAARIASTAKAGQVLVSKSTWEAASDQHVGMPSWLHIHLSAPLPKIPQEAVPGSAKSPAPPVGLASQAAGPVLTSGPLPAVSAPQDLSRQESRSSAGAAVLHSSSQQKQGDVAVGTLSKDLPSFRFSQLESISGDPKAHSSSQAEVQAGQAAGDVLSASVGPASFHAGKVAASPPVSNGETSSPLGSGYSSYAPPPSSMALNSKPPSRAAGSSADVVVRPGSSLLPYLSTCPDHLTTRGSLQSAAAQPSSLGFLQQGHQTSGKPEAGPHEEQGEEDEEQQEDDAVVATSLGVHNLKGIPEPLELFEVKFVHEGIVMVG